MSNISRTTGTQTEARALWRVATQTQTYVNMGYLLLSFICGIGYFVFLVVGLSVGLSTLIIWIGVPILVLTMAGWWYLAAFERRLVIDHLHIPIQPMSLPRNQARDESMLRWQRLREHLNNAMTWKTFAYLLLKFPLGILGFVALVSGLNLAVATLVVTCVLGMVVAPFVYLVSMFVSRQHPWQIVKRLWLLSLTGCLFPLYLLNELTMVLGLFARSMLGMSDKDLRLAEARGIIERERARAERADQSRRELIVNVSHELRTPVASIRGHVESLMMSIDEDKDELLSPADLRPYLGIVHREVERLGSLVEDLLSLARTESDELRLKLEPVAPEQVTEEVYQALAPLARRERQVTLINNVNQPFPSVMADRQRLGQVLLNLVRNAITYTPQGGIVSISIEPYDEQRLALVVADTGIGIPPEELKQVFERFYRTDASRARSSGGFGLGLAIVQDLVQAMGGSVMVSSKVNEGSCFRVLLKIA